MAKNRRNAHCDPEELINEQPATIKQLSAAMMALGKYTGKNSDEEHAAQIKHLGIHFYRLLLVYSLLGIVESETLQAANGDISREQLVAAERQMLTTLGTTSPSGVMHILSWRVLRIGNMIQGIAEDCKGNPLALAAAQTAEGLQLLLDLVAVWFNFDIPHADVNTRLATVRNILNSAIANIDTIQELITPRKDA
jgi:hypothetical protein